LRAEGFSCILDAHFKGRDKLIAISDKKYINFFPAVPYTFFITFGHQNPGSGLIRIRIGIQPKKLDPESMNPDPKHWL
jgi:hypothetical protein